MGSVWTAIVWLGWYLSFFSGVFLPIFSIYFLATGETVPIFTRPFYTELALEFIIIGLVMLLPSTCLIITNEPGILYYLSRTICGIIAILAIFLLLPRMIFLILVLCLLFFISIAVGIGYDELGDAFMPHDVIELLQAILRKD